MTGNNNDEMQSPIEVWLRQGNLEVTCEIVNPDESTNSLHVDSLSMRGAQREVTGYLIEHDYRPVGRWRNEAESYDGVSEASRTFKSTAQA